MGSYNSGGGRGATRQSSLRKLDMTDLKRLGMLRVGRNSSLCWSRNGERTADINVQTNAETIILTYRTRRFSEDWRDVRDVIPLSVTRPNYGGERHWFLCPGCGARRRVLWGGSYFRCRGCYAMTYDSQYEDEMSRILAKADAIRDKLGGDSLGSGVFPRRPKRMRRLTYQKLIAKDIAIKREFERMMLARFGEYF